MSFHDELALRQLEETGPAAVKRLMVWSAVIFVVALFMSSKVIDRMHDKRMHIHDVRERHAKVDAKHETIDHYIRNKTRSLHYNQMQEARILEEMQELRAAYSEDGYRAYRAQLQPYDHVRSMNEYLESLQMRYMLLENNFKRNADHIKRLDGEITALQQDYERELAAAQVERARMEKKYAYELNPRLDPSNIVDFNYFHLVFWALSGMVSFMVLYTLSPLFRYGVYSIAAVAAVRKLQDRV